MPGEMHNFYKHLSADVVFVQQILCSTGVPHTWKTGLTSGLQSVSSHATQLQLQDACSHAMQLQVEHAVRKLDIGKLTS